MKLILSIAIILLTCVFELNAQGGITSPDTYIKFINLALDGQYDIIKQELRAERYLVSKDIQPYSLNGVAYAVDFVYENPNNYYQLNSFSAFPMVSVNVKELNNYNEIVIFFRFVSLCKVLSINFDWLSSYYLSLYPDLFNHPDKSYKCTGLMNLKKGIKSPNPSQNNDGLELVNFYLFQTEEIYDRGFGTIVMNAVYRKRKDGTLSDTKIVKIHKYGSIDKVPISIGGEKYEYIIDSGASFLTIDENIEKKLTEMGVLRSTDYVGVVNLELADGQTKNFRKVILPTITIGNIKVNNIETVIIEDGNLLLGKSVLNKFKEWRIDNFKRELILE